MVIEAPPRFPPTLRWFGGALVATAPLLALLTTYWLWRDRLPDPMPSHWGASNQVDGVTPLATLTAVLGVIALVGAAVALAGAGLATMAPGLRRWLVAIGAGLGTIGGGVWLMTAVLALDAPEAHQAAAPTWQVLALTVAIGVTPALAYGVCPPPPPHPAATGRPAPQAPRVDLRPGERAVYTEVAYPGRVAWLLVALLTATAAALAVWTSWWAAAPLLLTGALTLALLTIRLTVDVRGVRAGFGPWGWPRVRVPLQEINEAQVTAVRPMEWGGWGYRIRPDGARGVITRRGQAVRLDLSGGRQFVASVRDAGTAAGLINTLIDRHRR
jgi:hypothetical protein